MRHARLVLLLALALVACTAAGPKGRDHAGAAAARQQDSMHAPRAGSAGGLVVMDPGTAVPVAATDPSWGDAGALVTLVVWGDYQCPFTAKLMGTLDELKQRYGPSGLRIVWKHNPLPFHERAYPVHVVAEAVRRLGGNAAFWRFHTMAFANQAELSELSALAWAAAAGVGKRELDAELRSDRPSRKVDADLAEGRHAGVKGTPSSFVNGVFIGGAHPAERFAKVIDEQGGRATAMLRDGVPRNRVYAELSERNKQLEPAPQPSKAEADTTTVWKVPVAGAPTRGAAAAPVTVVMFADFECRYCAKVMPTVVELERRYAGKLRLVFRHNPMVFHPRAEPAAQLATEARAQKGDRGFWEAAELLFSRHTELDDEHLADYATRLALDTGRVRRAIESHKHKSVIERDQDLADDLEAKGTPTFFINGRRLTGAQPADKFAAIIDEEIAKAERLVASGTRPAAVYDALQKDARVQVLERVIVAAPTAAQAGKGAARGAKVTIQMFSDFQCPFCKKVQPALDEVIAAFPGKVRVVWRHLPLPMHAQATIAAEAAEEAFRQKGDEGFWAMAKLLFEEQTPSAFERRALTDKARKLNLDVQAFDAALDSGRHRAKIEADAKVAAAAGFSGTPGFAVNDYFVSGAHPARHFERLVKRALGPREPLAPGSVRKPVGTGDDAPDAPAAGAERFGARHLLVMYQGSRRSPPTITRTKAEARARAEEALAKLRKGTAFTDLVREYSDEPGAAKREGDLGTFPKGAMVPEFQGALEKLSVGAHSSVVETPFGYHLILRTR